MPRDRQVWTSDLVTAEEAAQRLGMSQLALLNAAGRKRSEFPDPVCGRGAKSVWLWSEVVEWWDATHELSVETRKVTADSERNRGLHMNTRKRRVA